MYHTVIQTLNDTQTQANEGKYKQIKMVTDNETCKATTITTTKTETTNNSEKMFSLGRQVCNVHCSSSIMRTCHSFSMSSSGLYNSWLNDTWSNNTWSTQSFVEWQLVECNSWLNNFFNYFFFFTMRDDDHQTFVWDVWHHSSQYKTL